MAKVKGFNYNYSNAVTIGTSFALDGINFVSSYVYVSSSGGIVWMNNEGQLNYLADAQVGYHPMGATQILSSGTVNGETQTTTASGMTWCASTYP